jgi:UDP-N-acetylglucosamine acyltransferase
MAYTTTHHHPTAIISPQAELGASVRVGAFSIIEAGASIGEGTEIRSSAVIHGQSRIGRECVIHPGAIIAGDPQDLKFKGEETLAFVGDRTVIREYATIHRGTDATGKTVVGTDCLVMAYCHVAHDCTVGNHVIMSNVTQLAGHVTVHDFAILGGVTKVHQFCTIGSYAMTGAGTKVVKDIAPYLLVDGNPPQVQGVNKIGLKRRGFSDEAVKELEELYKMIMRSGLNVSAGIQKFLERGTVRPETQVAIDFIKASKRGISR